MRSTPESVITCAGLRRQPLHGQWHGQPSTCAPCEIKSATNLLRLRIRGCSLEKDIFTGKINAVRPRARPRRTKLCNGVHGYRYFEPTGPGVQILAFKWKRSYSTAGPKLLRKWTKLQVIQAFSPKRYNSAGEYFSPLRQTAPAEPMRGKNNRELPKDLAQKVQRACACRIICVNYHGNGARSAPKFAKLHTWNCRQMGPCATLLHLFATGWWVLCAPKLAEFRNVHGTI